MKHIALLPRKGAILLIIIYQHTLSLDHGPLKFLFPSGYCPFHPTCSQYTLEAIDKFGVIKGSVLGSWRIMRCNPWTSGGDDPVK